jgi:hypothetical protein
MISNFKKEELEVVFLKKTVIPDDMIWFLAYKDIVQLLTDFEVNIDYEERAKIDVDGDVVITELDWRGDSGSLMHPSSNITRTK